MSLSYAGVNLPVLTQEAYTAIESRISLRDCYPWDVIPGDIGRAGFGLIAKKWQDREPRLGRLSWPTGASRWATGFFLATDSQLDLIRAAVYEPEYIPGELILGDGTNSITASMYMLPPRPLFTGTTAAELWLLVLVDQRYFWWRNRTGNLTVSGSGKWSDAYNQLAGLLPDVTLKSDTPVDAYASPPALLSAVDEAIPPLLDYTARCCGQRIICPLSGPYVYAYGLASSDDILADNLLLPNARIGGGTLALLTEGDGVSILPASVQVDFPAQDGSGNWLGVVESLTIKFSELEILEGGETSGSVTLIYPLAAVLNPAWSNETTCLSVATQYATDYYLYRAANEDIVLAGIAEWEPEGYEDWIEWTYTRDVVSTRIQRSPWWSGEDAIPAAIPVPASNDAWISPQSGPPQTVEVFPPQGGSLLIQAYPAGTIGLPTNSPWGILQCWFYIPAQDYATQDKAGSDWYNAQTPLPQPNGNPPYQTNLPPCVGAYYWGRYFGKDANGYPVFMVSDAYASTKNAGSVNVGRQSFAGTKTFDWPSSTGSGAGLTQAPCAVAALGGLAIGTPSTSQGAGVVQAYAGWTSSTLVFTSITAAGDLQANGSIGLANTGDFYIGSPVQLPGLPVTNNMNVWIMANGTSYQGATGMDAAGNIFANGICVAVGGAAGSSSSGGGVSGTATLTAIDGGTWT